MSRLPKRPDATDYSQSRSFNVGIAMDVGIGAALIYDELLFFADKGSRGDGWVYKKYSDFVDRFPFMSERSVRRYVEDLVKGKYITKKIMKLNGTPTIHLRVLKRLGLREFSEHSTDGFGQSGQMEQAKVDKSIEMAKMSDSIYTSTNTATHITHIFEQLKAIIQPTAKWGKMYEPLLTKALKKVSAEELELGAREFVSRFKREKWRDRKYMTIKQFLTSDKDRVLRYEECLLLAQERQAQPESESKGFIVDASNNADVAAEAFKKDYEAAMAAKGSV